MCLKSHGCVSKCCGCRLCLVLCFNCLWCGVWHCCCHWSGCCFRLEPCFSNPSQSFHQSVLLLADSLKGICDGALWLSRLLHNCLPVVFRLVNRNRTVCVERCEGSSSTSCEFWRHILHCSLPRCLRLAPLITCGPCGVIVVGAIIATCSSSTVSILSCLPSGIVVFFSLM